MLYLLTLTTHLFSFCSQQRGVVMFIEISNAFPLSRRTIAELRYSLFPLILFIMWMEFIFGAHVEIYFRYLPDRDRNQCFPVSIARERSNKANIVLHLAVLVSDAFHIYPRRLEWFRYIFFWLQSIYVFA